MDDGNDAGRPESEPVVLGGQLATAIAAEGRHQAGAHGPSPLAGVAYEPELSLIRFTQVPADETLDELAGRFAVSSGGERARLRSALTMADFYTVLRYARRAAIRALRDGDGEVASRGVAALAMVDTDRIDWRDLAWEAAVLSYAIGRVGEDASGAFERAASLAAGDAAALLNSQAGEPLDSLIDWGLREIRTAAGVGLIEDEGSSYRPRADLVALAYVVAAGLEDGTWQLGDPVIGSDLPAIWLSAAEPGTTEMAIRSITGCALLHGVLARKDSPGASAQHMMVFLAETEEPRAAAIIAGAAGPGTAGSFAAVGVAAETLCAVLIARSVMAGTPGVETSESLERFRPALADALGRT